MQADDITESLARHGNTDQDKVFQQKHDQTVAYIRQNIHVQQNITQVMTERNAEYADARVKVEEVVRRREDSIGSLVASYHAYEDLTKTTKGLEFYDKLDANVTKLLARVGGVVRGEIRSLVAGQNSTWTPHLPPLLCPTCACYLTPTASWCSGTPAPSTWASTAQRERSGAADGVPISAAQAAAPQAGQSCFNP